MKMNYHKRMTPKREGPFEVEEVLGPVTYQLKLPTTWKIHNVFHAVLLKPHIKKRYMEETSLGQSWTFLMEKKSITWKQF
jgi:hypothetical protein